MPKIGVLTGIYFVECQVPDCPRWYTFYITALYRRQSRIQRNTILKKSWRQHPTKQQLYDHQLPILKTIQIRCTRYTGHYWRSKDKLRSDGPLWTPSHRWVRVGRPVRTYLQQLCTDTECSMEDLLEVMDNRSKWWERVREICTSSMTWWYIYIYIYIYMYKCPILFLSHMIHTKNFKNGTWYLLA